MTGVLEGIAAAALVGTLGTVGVGVKRVLSKLDAMDAVVRGDGNGNPGLGEKIRDVHAEVTEVKNGLLAHVEESVPWKNRIVDAEVRLGKVETRCALVDCEDLDKE